MGLNLRPKQPMVGLPGERGRGGGGLSLNAPPLHQGKGWLTFMKATHWDRWPHPQPLAVQNSLLADGIVSLYLFPHSLLCMSAKNLPVISKLRQKVPPVLSAVNKRLPLRRSDLTRTQGCSVGLPPEKALRDQHVPQVGTGVQRELYCQQSGQNITEFLYLKTCLLFLVWKLRNYILALHSQSSSSITENVWVLLLISFGNGLG